MWGDRVYYGIDNSMSGVPFSRSRRYLVILACLFVLSAGVSAAPQQVTVDEVTLTGDSVIKTEDGITHVAKWKSYSIQANVTGDSGQYQTCLVIGPPANRREIACEKIEVTNDTPETIAFTQKRWPENASERQTLSIIVRENNSTTTDSKSLQTTSIQVDIYPENRDADDDDLSNRDELQIGTKIDNRDTDGDGLIDGKERNVINSNPKQRDSDNDGLSDRIEWEKYKTSPIKNDSDNDTLSDPKEINKLNTDPAKPDTDGDGLLDNVELQKYDTNPSERDTDGDGLNDRREVNALNTEPGKKDSDGDQLLDNEEVNEYETNPNKRDHDGDGLGDGAEVHKYGTNPKAVDTDGDGVSDATEISRGRDPNGDTRKVFGYTVKNPQEVGIGAVAVCLVAIAGLGYRRYRKRRSTRDEKPTVDPAQSIDDSTQPELAAEREQRTDETGVSEPLTDEDRIMQLLSESDGRLRQSEIVAETGWSKSKVSRLLSRMEDDGKITKITVGRENLITRSGDEPRHAGSAFED